jgi:CubicO group peptidase (beta-lactamase class C family)
MPTSEMAGLWSGERDFGPLAAGDLTVDARGPSWIASVAGFRVPVKLDNSQLTFALPQNQGSFRGRFTADEIFGFWTQPVPVRSIYQFDSGVLLTSAGKKVWRGTLHPLPDRIGMYLKMSADQQGNVTAFFRDSEIDLYGGKNYAVHCEEERIHFVNVADAKDFIDGIIHADSRQISLRVSLDDPEHTFTFEFSRVAATVANRYFAALPGSSPFVYERPINDDDGWTMAEAADVGMSSAVLADAVRAIDNTPINDSNAPFIQALLVARHGKLVVDQYFYGFAREQTHDLRSTGKSFTTALVGIALAENPSLHVDTRILPLFVQYEPKNVDDRKRRITVRDLLTMTSGLDCDDANRASLGREMTLFTQHAQPDYYAYTLDLPMVREPGGAKAIYCSATMNLLGGVIKSVTHKDLADYFHEKLAVPLEFKSYQLNLSPTGDVYMGGGLYLRARDALKLGQVYLDSGLWNGKRVLDAEWVNQSTSVQSSFSSEHGYGFGWHIFSHLNLNGREYREFEAEGTGGQLVIVIPELDLAVGMLTANYSRDMTDPERKVLAEIVSAVATPTQ